MKVSEGDFQKADYAMDCTVFNWFYRLQQKGKYGKWLKEQMKVKS